MADTETVLKEAEARYNEQQASATGNEEDQDDEDEGEVEVIWDPSWEQGKEGTQGTAEGPSGHDEGSPEQSSSAMSSMMSDIMRRLTTDPDAGAVLVNSPAMRTLIGKAQQHIDAGEMDGFQEAYKAMLELLEDS